MVKKLIFEKLNDLGFPKTSNTNIRREVAIAP